MKTETVVLQEGQKSASPKATRQGGERAAGDPVLLAVVDWYGSGVKAVLDSKTHLTFLRTVRAQLEARQVAMDRALRLVPLFRRSRLFELLLMVEYHRTIQQQLPAFEDVVKGITPYLRRVRVPASARLYIRLYRTRHVVYGLGVVLGALLIFVGYSLVSWSAGHLNTYLAEKYQRYRAPIVVTLAGQANQSSGAAGTAGARFLPGYKPEQVWQVESTAEFERYSNGARILKRYETDNHPRGYYLIPRGAEAVGDQLRREIAGIVYHTSESDILPFVSENNQSIKYRSQGLLEYVRRNKSYNYLIDRYGEVYRIVRDDHAAFHAGHSIWGDERYNYVGLNESFIGICFESTSTAGSLEETLTEAQIVSGRALTNVLRSRYNIEDVNCTTHGLVSINPDKMLVAFHYDWVRNFPFEAMGLSDKYKVAPPNMLDYGFTYDEETLEKLKNVLWPGAVEAEQEFRRRVERSKMGAEPLRQRLRDRYLAQLNRARQLRPPDGDGDGAADGSTAETRR